MKMLTLAELAEEFKIDVTEAESLRKRHRWPHVKVGRKNVRFTETQVAAIVASMTVAAPASKSTPVVGGQTAGSKARAT